MDLFWKPMGTLWVRSMRVHWFLAFKPEVDKVADSQELGI
jgi:hypothetical protein